MTFLNITDPRERDKLVQDFLQTKRNIQLNNLSERLGDIELKREMTKIYSPIIESQQKVALDTQKAIAEIPQKLSIDYSKKLAIDEPSISTIATKGKKIGDTAFGLYDFEGQLMIGNAKVTIDENGDYVIGEIKYKGTPGLQQLLTNKDPQNFTEEDKNTYKEILHTTGALFRKDGKPKTGQGDKYYKIIKPIREELLMQSRSLPSIEITDPNELIKRFSLLLASKESGNTGVDEEMKYIVDKLYNEKIISSEQYETMKEQSLN